MKVSYTPIYDMIESNFKKEELDTICLFRITMAQPKEGGGTFPKTEAEPCFQFQMPFLEDFVPNSMNFHRNLLNFVPMTQSAA
jgi:hypothetical protein